jgi:hypothetical protein
MKGYSLRAAVDQHCKQCIYDNCCPGTWRQQVALCSVKGCALWEVRPRTTKPLLESLAAQERAKIGSSEACKGIKGGA